MAEPTIVIRYYSRKMLLTLDLNTLMEVILRGSPESDPTVCFEPMNDVERSASTARGPIFDSVSNRILVFRKLSSGEMVSVLDVEATAIREGQK